MAHSEESHRSLAAESLFDQYLRRRASEASASFEAFCAQHPELNSELRRMKEDWSALGRVRDEVEQDSTGAHSEWAGRIRSSGDPAARYRVLEEVGRGGMGQVLRVWDAPLKRELAMKVIRSSRDGASSVESVAPQMLARFLEEAQITSQLDHPGVIPVHELGIDNEGRAFFTMRLVQGRTLADAFELARTGEEGWSQTRCLNALLKVCEAMAYAHDKGVIHRDLKPSNVMVGKYGEVYVVDWGLARVWPGDARAQEPSSRAPSIVTDRQVEREATPQSPVLTDEHAALGTPEFAAPEQAAGNSAQIGPWSDVYAVGAMLYQCLAGRSPYVAHGDRLTAAQVLARVVAGPPPTLVDIAPRTAPELVAIQEKAMAREVSERFADMSELANDLRAFLEQRVVRAYETGAWAELRKWVRRNRPFAIASVTALLLLVAGAVTSSMLFVRAAENEARAESKAQEALANLELATANERKAHEAAAAAEAARASEALERERAEQREQQVARIAEFQSDTLSRIQTSDLGRRLGEHLRTEARAVAARSAGQVGGVDSSAFEQALRVVNLTDVARSSLAEVLLEPASRTVARQFAEDPAVEHRLRATLARAYWNLALHERAIEQLARCIDITMAEGEPGLARLSSNLNDMAVDLDEMGRMDDAYAYYVAALDARLRSLGPHDGNTLLTMSNLAVLEMSRRRFNSASDLLLAAKRGYEAAGPTQTRGLLRTCSNLGSLERRLGNSVAAAYWFRHALELRRCELGDDHEETLTSFNNLATVLTELDEYAEAERLLSIALPFLRSKRGERHPQTLTAINNLSLLNVRVGRLDLAEPYARQALEGFCAAYGERHESSMTVMHNLASIFDDLGRSEEAIELQERCAELRADVLGVSHPDYLDSRSNLGIYLRGAGRHADALPHLLEVAGKFQAHRGPRRNSLFTIEAIAGSQTQLERWDDAAAAFEWLIHLRAAVFGPDDAALARLNNNHGYVLRRAGRYAESRDAYLRAIELRERLNQTESVEHGATLLNAAYAYIELGSWDAAADRLAEAAVFFEVKRPPDAALRLDTIRVAEAAVRRGRGHTQEAVEALRAMLSDAPSLAPPAAVEAWEILARCELDLGRLAEAKCCLESALELAVLPVAAGATPAAELRRQLEAIERLERDAGSQ